MKFSDMFISLIIILLFIGMYAFSLLSVGLKKIQDEWPDYRCNPMVMPFASSLGPAGTDTTTNFSTCIQTQMKGMMGTLLKPVHYATSLANNMGGEITTAIQHIRVEINSLTTMITSIITQIFSVFINLLSKVIFMVLKMKDLGGKIIGSMAVSLFVISGMVKTGTSIWAGPLGDVVRFLCFHPRTIVYLKNGCKKAMSEINVGDVLENNSKVLGKLELQGSEKNPYYKIYSIKLQQWIYVTGTHLIEDPTTGRFMEVSTMKDAIKTNDFTTHMNCLITDDHLIPVGEYTFWDWEDGN